MIVSAMTVCCISLGLHGDVVQQPPGCVSQDLYVHACVLLYMAASPKGFGHHLVSHQIPWYTVSTMAQTHALPPVSSRSFLLDSSKLFSLLGPALLPELDTAVALGTLMEDVSLVASYSHAQLSLQQAIVALYAGSMRYNKQKQQDEAEVPPQQLLNVALQVRLGQLLAG